MAKSSGGSETQQLGVHAKIFAAAVWKNVVVGHRRLRFVHMLIGFSCYGGLAILGAQFIRSEFTKSVDDEYHRELQVVFWTANTVPMMLSMLQVSMVQHVLSELVMDKEEKTKVTPKHDSFKLDN